MSDGLRFADVFAELSAPEGIAPASVRRVFDSILAGQWTPVQVAGFVVALRLQGEPPAVIAAAAEAMRSAMVGVDHGLETVLDTCGTGGDGQGTLNLSTGAAIIAAAAGAPVAKHGNRAVSSQAGSADVLEALDIPLNVPPNRAATVLREANITFLMAPVHHPAMRHAVVARKELGIRTIFNCLGPLASPARATHQLLGAYDDSLRETFAQTLRELGTQRAWVVRGADGIDEVSPFGPTRVTELEGGEIRELTVTPETFGLTPSPAGAITGGNAAANAEVLEQVLSGQPHPSADAFLLNAAAALVVAEGLEPRAALERARETVTSGAAQRTLQRWREVAQQNK